MKFDSFLTTQPLFYGFVHSFQVSNVSMVYSNNLILLELEYKEKTLWVDIAQVHVTYNTRGESLEKGTNTVTKDTRIWNSHVETTQESISIRYKL